MTFKNIDEAKEFITSVPYISFDDSFSLAQLCSRNLCEPEKENQGRELIIRVLDIWDQISSKTYPVWNDLLDAAGLYPYCKKELMSDSSSIRYEYHKSPYLDDVYFHQEQLEISLKLLSNNSVVLSAPTSFGKSLLIEEIVASKKYHNIVVIQPTLALLDETRKKFKKYSGNYKLIVSTRQEPSDHFRNIFLFTGERVVEYEGFKDIDFFVIDEFYKLSLGRDDERAIALNQAFYKLLKFTKNFYLLGPMVKSIPPTFLERFKFSWHRTNFSTVAIDVISKTITEGDRKKKVELKQQRLFELLEILEEPTLIYCSSPSKATNLTLNYIKYLESRSLLSGPVEKEKNQEFCAWIEENIHPEWILIKALKHGIAFHHGALPRHLGSSIVDAFNNGHVKYIFCTATLIEGVNTTAKNVILFDKQKGTKQIDYFDYRNIAGRSGRMSQYFIGRVFRFEDEPLQLELEIDIPIITQDNAPMELLIQIDDSELTTSARTKLVLFNRLDGQLQELIKRNAGLPIEGQLNFIKIIEHDLNHYNRLLNWDNVPTFEKLFTVLELAWQNLLKKGESKGGIRSPKQLAYLTMRYFEFKSIPPLIKSTVSSQYYLEKYTDPEERINQAIYTILNTVRHWFAYKLPKLFSAASQLQEYVFSRHNLPYGNYTYFASQIENDFLPANLAALLEYDIPVSAIKKLRPLFDDSLEVEEIIAKILETPLRKHGLIDYELNKIDAAFSK